MAGDLSAVIEEQYLGRCEALASSLARPGSRGINGVEYDDLVQEGMIAVWQTITKAITPSDKVIRGRMLNYMRWLGRQGVAYGTMLPLDDYAEAISRGTRSDVRVGDMGLPGEERDGKEPIRFLGEVQGD